MEDTFRNIKDMLNAGFPLLYLVTSEYSRVTQKLRKIAFEGDYAFHTWDCVDYLRTHNKSASNRLEGIVSHPEHESTQDCETLLEFLHKGLGKSEDKSKEIFVIEDFHKYFDREKVIVSLRKLSYEMKELNKHIIFLSPSYQLPDEIEKYVTVVSVPLPDRRDLDLRFKSVYPEPIDEDLKKYILDAALGLTDTEAELAFRLANQIVGLNNKDAVQIVANVVAWIVVAPVLDILIYSEPANKVFVQGVFACLGNVIITAILGTLLGVGYTKIGAKSSSLSKED